MGKKRRVWWIVGALVVAVALFAAIAFLVDYNSTDARVERAVAQIVEEYGFEYQGRADSWFDKSKGILTGDEYRSPAIGTEQADGIVAILRDACPSWQYEHSAFDEDLQHITATDGDPTIELHTFTSTEPRGGIIAIIGFVPDDDGMASAGADHTAVLSLNIFDRPGLWQRIKGLWPW